MTETIDERIPKFEIQFYQDGHLNICYCDQWIVEPLGGLFIVTCSEIYYDNIEAIGFPESYLRQIRQLHGYKEDHKKAVKMQQDMFAKMSDKNNPDISGDAAFG